VAHVKSQDWLKTWADAIFNALEEGLLTLNASSAILIELYYALEDLGFSGEAIMLKEGVLLAVKGLRFLHFNGEVMLAAQTVMRAFKMPSLFDSIYAAATLNQDPDRTILSTDEVYDRVPGIERVDPREFRLPNLG